MTADEALALIKASDKRFYCYILSRPDGRPFYIGSGKGKRVFAHEFDARRGYRGHKQSLIRRILKDGESIDYSITEFFEMREDASAEECRLIALYGRADIGTGHLLNRTDGGDGARGLLLTDDERAKMSASAKRRGSLPFIEGARKWRAENMDALIAERQSRWKNPGAKARLLDAMRDPDVRKVMSDLMHERLRDPKKRKKLADAVSAARSRPVTINGTIYRSVTAAAKALGVSPPAIRYHLKKQTPGYSYS